MKKAIVCIVFLLAICQTAQAQYSDYYYHRVGDTIEWRSEIGYYSWWEFERCYQDNIMVMYDTNSWTSVVGFLLGGFGYGYVDSTIVLQRFYTPSPLKIIGVAGNVAKNYRSPEDTSYRQDYYYIYDANDTGLIQKAEVPWQQDDPYRTLHIQYHEVFHNPCGDSCCCHHPADAYLPIQEYYFDSAIWVTDSFYVGGSYFNNIHNVGDSSLLKTIYGTVCFPGMVICPGEEEYMQSLGSFINCAPVGVVWLYKRELGENFTPDHTPFHEKPWYRCDPFPASLMIYPIIEVDTTVPPASACDSIANVQVTVAGTSATVTWDGFPNYSRVLLRYGKINEPQSQWREEDVTGSTLYTLTGLQPVSYYKVTLMAECDTCKKETPWSAPVTFYVGTDTSGGGTEGVEGATLLSRLTFLAPNPAQDEVTVTSSFNLTAIDIWTADGVMVYHGNRSGHDATVDVSWLRAGTYIVAIHTHNGTTHKRLVIAH